MPGSMGQECWSGLPKRKVFQSEVKDASETNPHASGHECIQVLANIVSVQNLHTSDFPGDDAKDEHPFLRHQARIPVTGTVGTVGFGLRVKRGAEKISAAAAVENCQSRHLCRQIGFALLYEKLAKLGGELGERVGEEQLFFFLHVRCRF